MRHFAALVGLAVAVLVAAPAVAQEFPSKPIKVIIPFTAGGAVDVIIRALAPALSADLGQPIIVENKPGGGAQIAAAALQQAPADGHTLFAAPGGAYSLNPNLYKKLSYDPVADFDGVSTLLTAPMVMFTQPTSRLSTLSALQQALKSGGEVLYASPGQGTAPHLFGHVIGRSSPAARFVHVAYRGAPQAIHAVLAKEVDLMFDAVPSALGMVKNAQVQPLAIASERRHPLLPEVPTLKEAGLPQVTMDFWVGVVAKKGTPSHVLARLHGAFEKAMNDPATLKQFESRGYTRLSLSPGAFDELIRTELKRYGPIVRDSGVVIE